MSTFTINSNMSEAEITSLPAIGPMTKEDLNSMALATRFSQTPESHWKGLVRRNPNRRLYSFQARYIPANKPEDTKVEIIYDYIDRQAKQNKVCREVYPFLQTWEKADPSLAISHKEKATYNLETEAFAQFLGEFNHAASHEEGTLFELQRKHLSWLIRKFIRKNMTPEQKADFLAQTGLEDNEDTHWVFRLMA